MRNTRTKYKLKWQGMADDRRTEHWKCSPKGIGTGRMCCIVLFDLPDWKNASTRAW